MTYDELLVKTLEKIKEKVMRMPEDADAEMKRKMAEHDANHQVELMENFMDVWLLIWERKTVCEKRNLFFLLGVLECDTCCQIFRTSPSSMEAFIRESPSVQRWFSEKKNQLTGALVLAEEVSDKLLIDLITMLLFKLEKQRKGEIR